MREKRSVPPPGANGVTMRRAFDDIMDMESWRGSAIGSAAFLIVAAIFHFVGVASTAAFGDRAVRALVFSGETFAAGLAIGLLIWTGVWLASGRETTVGMKDTILWTASVFGLLCLGLAVLS